MQQQNGVHLQQCGRMLPAGGRLLAQLYGVCCGVGVRMLPRLFRKLLPHLLDAVLSGFWSGMWLGLLW